MPRAVPLCALIIGLAASPGSADGDAGVPRLSNSPAYATEFTVTPGDIDNLVAFVLTLKNWKRR